MSFRIVAGIVMFCLGPLSWATPGLVTKVSPHDVDETVERVETLLGNKGIRVFAVVDHQENAEGAGLEVGEITMILFGNPNLGTPLMQSNPTIGIDLPMKILVWRGADDKVYLAYNDPEYLARRHGITDREDVVTKMSGALSNLTDKAIEP
ncbi:MAG: DUF302 domain-containing protein [Gammaproteobacteria bacterium]|nr:DUF302 domain-containing protein [Gammaproteobacteria bacterium]